MWKLSGRTLKAKKERNWPTEFLILPSLPISCFKSATKKLWRRKSRERLKAAGGRRSLIGRLLLGERARRRKRSRLKKKRKEFSSRKDFWKKGNFRPATIITE